MKFEERVLQQEFTLNDTDDLIVDYIRKNKANLEHLSIQKVAEDLYLVPNSIMRLCKKLGYKGFAEMKFLVNNEVSTKFGGVAQLGEHLPCKQGVRSSILLISTNPADKPGHCSLKTV